MVPRSTKKTCARRHEVSDITTHHSNHLAGHGWDGISSILNTLCIANIVMHSATFIPLVLSCNQRMAHFNGFGNVNDYLHAAHFVQCRNIYINAERLHRKSTTTQRCFAWVQGQWIGLRENLNRKPWFLHVFTIKYIYIYMWVFYGFLWFSVNFPIIQFYDRGTKTPKCWLAPLGWNLGILNNPWCIWLSPEKDECQPGSHTAWKQNIWNHQALQFAHCFFFRSYTPVMTRLPIWWRQQLASLSSQASKSPAGTGRGRVGQPVAEETTPAVQFLVVSIPKTGECLKMRPTWPFWSGKPADYAGYASKTSG